jgi:hypothetical protein
MTFQELCESINNVNFYELIENTWIKNIIIDFNKMGFYTVTSQPGKLETNVTVYKTKYDRKYNNSENIIISNDYSRKQRAYVRGYMNIDMANYIIRNLSNDDFIHVRSSNHNSIINDEIKLGSVIFKHETPIIYFMSKEIDIKNIPDADESYDLSEPLHRPLNIINSDDIVEFDIVDKRWCENNFMWYKLHYLIKKYHNL